MTLEEDAVRDAAIAYARENKEQIAKDVASTSRYPSERNPVSIFMAGSPGAGKTEFSKDLIQTLRGTTDPVRIDSDDFRSALPGYTGSNSHLFNGATSIIIEKVHDHALHLRQSFILDGTFSKPIKARDNIRRSLDKGRPVFLFYVYDDPVSAWQFTQARERTEGRNIPKTAFISEFFGARDTVLAMMSEFGSRIMVFLVRKNLAGDDAQNEFAVSLLQSGDIIDKYVNRQYTADELNELL